MANIRQTSFLAGELAPYLWGRTDISYYGKGARRLKNFFVDKRGPAVSRPGTRYVATAKFTTAVRLVPFVYSDSVAFVIELGNLYARFHSREGGMIGEIVTPWATAQLAGIQWSQVGAVLTVTHPDVAPQEIRASFSLSYTFTIAPISFSTPQPQWRSLPVQTATTRAPYLLETSADCLFLPSATRPALPWIWWASATMRYRDTGVTFETRPERVSGWVSVGGVYSALDESDLIVLAPDHPIHISRADYGAPPAAESPDDHLDVLSYNFYRGKGSTASQATADSFLVGYVGSTTGLVFVDDGREPNYLVPPLLPELATEPPYSAAEGYPSCSGMFEERRVFAGRSGSPGTLRLSSTGDYVDFDRRALPYPGCPLEFELAARRFERIRSMVALDKLLVLTDASVWAIGGSQGPIDYDSVQARVVDEVGAAPIQPLVALGRALYVRTKGTGVRLLTPSPEGNSVMPIDVSAHAQHLLTTTAGLLPIVDWTFAEDPWGVIWAVRSDGALLSMTPSGDFHGWAHHETDGQVLSVASIPGPGGAIPGLNEDLVYLAVRRTLTTGGVTTSPIYIEFMESRVFTDSQYDGASLDCSKQQVVSASGGVVSSLERYETKEVYVMARLNPVLGPFVVTGGAITLPPLTPNDGANTRIFIGLAFTCELETLDLPSTEAQLRQKQVVSIGFEVDNTKGLWVGQDADHLVEWRRRTIEGGYASPSAATDLVKVQVSGKWGLSARAVLRQVDPLPVTVLGINREVDVGG